MNLFRKKCAYCNRKIEKGDEIFRSVKTPLFKDKKERTFCCEKHADNYELGVSNAKKCGGCCG